VTLITRPRGASRAPRPRGLRQPAPAPLAEARTMHWAFWVMLSIVSAASPRGPAPSEADQQAADDEQTLRTAGLTVDAPALREFSRQRSPLAAAAAELQPPPRQLSDPAAEVRTRAGAALVARGAAALPALRHAANGLSSPVAAEHARQCLQ